MTKFKVIKNENSEYSTPNFQVSVEAYHQDDDNGLLFLSHLECTIYFKGKLSSVMTRSMQVFYYEKDAERYFERLEQICKVVLVLLSHVKEYGRGFATMEGIIDDDIESVAERLLTEFYMENQHET